VSRCWCVLVFVLLGGCYPVGELQTARVVKPQHARWAIGVRGDTGSAAPDLGVRFGIAPRVDVGVRVTVAAAEAGAKLAVVDEQAVAISIAPAVMLARDLDLYRVWDDEKDQNAVDATALVFRVPLFIGVRVTETVEPWIAPALHIVDYRGSGSGFGPGSTVWAFGGSFGLDLIAGAVIIQPQLSIYIPVAGPELDLPLMDGGDKLRLSMGDRRFAFSFNFYFGKGDQ